MPQLPKRIIHLLGQFIPRSTLIRIVTITTLILGVVHAVDPTLIPKDFIFNEPAVSTQNTEEPHTFTVTDVIDGDTIRVTQNGIKETVRLLGIDTPEIARPNTPVECFAQEASARAKALLVNQTIRLEADLSQSDRDKYDRLLRYVFLEDGTPVNLLLIEEGFAHEYTYDMPYRYQSEFKSAESRAREARVGLWGPVCNP